VSAEWTRRAVDRRGELAGSAMSVAMAMLFAGVVILGSKVQAGGPPFVTLAIRFGGQSVLLVGLALMLGRPGLPAQGERLALAVAGTLGYGTEAALYFSALNHGSAAAITLLFYTYPVWVMLATIGLDRRAPPPALFVALALAIGGSAVVVLGGGDEADVEPLGIELALATAVTYTAYLVGTDRHVRRTDPVTAAGWLGAGAAVANVVFALVLGSLVMPPGATPMRLVAIVLVSAGAFAAMLAGLQKVGAVRNAIIGVLEPLTVAVLASVFLDQPITPVVAAGGIFILVGAVIASAVRTTAPADPKVCGPVPDGPRSSTRTRRTCDRARRPWSRCARTAWCSTGPSSIPAAAASRATRGSCDGTVASAAWPTPRSRATTAAWCTRSTTPRRRRRSERP
jgi:drug/metabolite transporter (DMT)-like permease